MSDDKPWGLAVQSGNHLEWAEELPPDCPPDYAYPPQYDMFYRLVKDYPPEEKDFFSHRKLFPHKRFNTDECRARSISIFNQLDNCILLLKLPAHKHKKVIQLILPPDSGVILQTGQKAHFSWWRRRHYNPLADYKEVNDKLKGE